MYDKNFCCYFPWDHVNNFFGTIFISIPCRDIQLIGLYANNKTTDVMLYKECPQNYLFYSKQFNLENN